ncbi:hypothetical protein ABK040_015200 [Willaertia magna]
MQPQQQSHQIATPQLLNPQTYQFPSKKANIEAHYNNSDVELSISNNVGCENKCSKLALEEQCIYAYLMPNHNLLHLQIQTKDVIIKKEGSSNELKFSIAKLPSNEHAIISRFLILTLSCFITKSNETSSDDGTYYTSLIVNVKLEGNSNYSVSWVNIDDNWKRSKEESIKWLHDLSIPKPSAMMMQTSPYNTVQPPKLPLAMAPPSHPSLQGNPVFLNYHPHAYFPQGTTLNSLPQLIPTVTTITTPPPSKKSGSIVTTPKEQSSSSKNDSKTPSSDKKQIAPHTKPINMEEGLYYMGKEYTVCLTGSANLKKIYSLSTQLGSSFLLLDILKVGIEYVDTRSNTKEFKEIDKKKMVKYDFEESKYLRFLLKTVGERSPSSKSKYVAVFVSIPKEDLTLKISMPVYRYEHGGYNYTKEEGVKFELFYSASEEKSEEQVAAVLVQLNTEDDKMVDDDNPKKRKQNTPSEMTLDELKMLLPYKKGDTTQNLLIDEPELLYAINLFGVMNPSDVDVLVVKKKDSKEEAKPFIHYNIRNSDVLTIVFSCYRLFATSNSNKFEEDVPCDLLVKLKNGMTICSKETFLLKRNRTVGWLLDQFQRLSLKERNNFLLEVEHQMTEKKKNEEASSSDLMEDEEEGFSDTDEPLSFEEQNEHLVDKLKKLDNEESQMMIQFVNNKLIQNSTDNQIPSKDAIIKHLVPSKFLESNIGKISSTHKRDSIHFVVKAFIEEKLDEKDSDKRKYICSFLFGKWKVEWKENSFVACTPLTNSRELIYSTDVFRIDQKTYMRLNDNKEQISKMFNDFVYQFAKFCCMWNAVMNYDEKNCNSSHFVYCLIKQLKLEEQKYLSTDDLLFPYLQNIAENSAVQLRYKPTVDFVVNSSQFIDFNDPKFKPEWKPFAEWLIKNRGAVQADMDLEGRTAVDLVFNKPKDINDFCLFVNFVYPGYFNKADVQTELRLLRNILISNIYKLSQIDEFNQLFAFNMYLNIANNSITRVKYIVGRGDSVLEGKVIPNEFIDFERSLISNIDLAVK